MPVLRANMFPKEDLACHDGRLGITFWDDSGAFTEQKG